MDALLFLAGMVFVGIFLAVSLLRKGFVIAIFPFIGGIVGAVITTQLASDTNIAAPSGPVSAYPWILIPAFLTLLCQLVASWRMMMAKRHEMDNTPERFVLIVLFVFMVGIGATVMPGAISGLRASNLLNAGLTFLVSSLIGLFTIGTFFAFVIGGWKAGA